MQHENILFLRKDKHPDKILVFWEDFEPDIPMRPQDYAFEEVLTALQLYELRKQHLQGYPCQDCNKGWSDVQVTGSGKIKVHSCKEHCAKYVHFKHSLTTKK